MRIPKAEFLEGSKDARPGLFALVQTFTNFDADRALAREYMSLVTNVDVTSGLHAPLLTIISAAEGMHDQEKLRGMIAVAHMQRDLARRIIADGFHTMLCHAFISQWAAHEAGIENLLSILIHTRSAAAQVAVDRLPSKKLPSSLEHYSWDKDVCRSVVKRLMKQAADEMKPEKSSYQQLVVVLGWFGFVLTRNEKVQRDYDEANGVRNILLHDYGYISEKYAHKYPGLVEFKGDHFCMSIERLDRYSDSIRSILLELISGYFKSPCAD